MPCSDMESGGFNSQIPSSLIEKISPSANCSRSGALSMETKRHLKVLSGTFEPLRGTFEPARRTVMSNFSLKPLNLYVEASCGTFQNLRPAPQTTPNLDPSFSSWGTKSLPCHALVFQQSPAAWIEHPDALFTLQMAQEK